MTKNRHEVIMTIIYYSEENNGGKAYKELEELLLDRGYKLEQFEHNLR